MIRTARTALLASVGLLMAVPATALADMGDLYLFDLRNTRQLFTISPSDPGTRNFIGTGLDYGTFAMDFDPTATTLYAINSDTRALGTIDMSNGSFNASTALSGDYDPSGVGINGLSFAPNGAAFIHTSRNLFSLDIATGQTTSIGEFRDAAGEPAGGTMIDIAVDANGQMYGHSITENGLFRIDSSSGVVDFVGAHGLTTNFAQGMDFDWSTNTLYAAFYTGGGAGQIAAWDTGDASITTLVDTTPWNSEMELSVRAVVPAPGAAATLALAGLVGLRRRR